MSTTTCHTLKPALEKSPEMEGQNNVQTCDCKTDLTGFEWIPGGYFTREFVNKMLISKVSENKKLSYFYMQSRVLFRYLSYKIGSEGMIKLRWKIQEKQCTGSHHVPSRQYIGSKAEGLNTHGSDRYLLFIVGEACEETGTHDSSLKFIYNSLHNDNYPGYILLEVLTNRSRQTNQRYYLRSIDFQSMFLFCFKSSMLAYFAHGPAIVGNADSIFGNAVDFVICLKSSTWPHIANEWNYRNRNFNWPSKAIVSDIVSKGCHLVPVSSKVDILNGDQWRLSFSIAETKLVRSFNYTHILVYGLLKIILKEFIEKDENLKDLLCSYFLKTTLFWVIEETDKRLWDPKHTIVCFCICIARILKYVIEENCPNYFVPNNNMFIRRFTKAQKDALVVMLLELYEQGFTRLTRSKTMSELLTYIKEPYNIFELDYFKKKNERKESVSIVFSLITECERSINSFSQGKNVLLKQRFIKSLLHMPIVKESVAHYFCHLINIDPKNMNNKEKYSLKKLILNLILHGSKIDRASGKAMLATWLYRQGKFDDCITVTEDAVFSFRKGYFLFATFSLTELTENSDESFRTSIYENLRFSTKNILIPIISHVAPIELMSGLFKLDEGRVLTLDNKDLSGITVHPELYLYFIQSLCYLQLEDYKRFDDAVNNMSTCRDLGTKEEDFCYLSKQIILKCIAKINRNIKENNPSRSNESLVISKIIYREAQSLFNSEIFGKFIELLSSKSADQSKMKDTITKLLYLQKHVKFTKAPCTTENAK